MQGVKPSSFPSVFWSMTSQSGPAVWTHSPIPVPPRCPPTFPFVYPPGMCNPSSSTSSTTDQEDQLHCCSLLFKNRLGYQLRDLDASWGLRNVSTLPRALISAWILWVIVSVCLWVYVCVCMKIDPVLLVKERGFSVQMREWTELEMSFTAGGFLSTSDGYCSAEQLQYYGESTVMLVLLLLSLWCLHLLLLLFSLQLLLKEPRNWNIKHCLMGFLILILS